MLKPLKGLQPFSSPAAPIASNVLHVDITSLAAIAAACAATAGAPSRFDLGCGPLALEEVHRLEVLVVADEKIQSGELARWNWLGEMLQALLHQILLQLVGVAEDALDFISREARTVVASAALEGLTGHEANLVVAGTKAFQARVKVGPAHGECVLVCDSWA